MNKSGDFFAKIKRTLSLINQVRQLKTGIILLVVIILLALLAPMLATHDPFALNDDMVNPPCKNYLLGTDGLGRDIFSGILYGARTSITIGVVAASISGIVGTLLGGISGFYGGKIDAVLSEVINVFLMMPTFFLILIIVALFGSSMLNVMIVIGVTTWTGNARLMRAQALSLKQRTFVKSMETIGESKIKTLVKHIIPNGIFPIIANTTMNISEAILTESGLSFLGLGDPNVMSWGQMVYNGKSYLTNGWWISTFSGAAIVLTVLTFYLIGDGMNNILSPKLNDNK